MKKKKKIIWRLKYWSPVTTTKSLCLCVLDLKTSSPNVQYTDFDIRGAYIVCFHFSVTRVKMKQAREESNRYFQSLYHGQERPEIWRGKNVCPKIKKETLMAGLQWKLGTLKCLICSNKNNNPKVDGSHKVKVSEWIKEFPKKETDCTEQMPSLGVEWLIKTRLVLWWLCMRREDGNTNDLETEKELAFSFTKLC